MGDAQYVGTVVENYDFVFEQRRSEVAFGVIRVDGGDITEDDEIRLKEYLMDMGKWETVVKAVSDIMSGTGLSKTTPSEAVRLDVEPYEVTIDERKEDGVQGVVSLSPEERRRRSGGMVGGSFPLPLQEVEERIQNVGKWRNLQRAISSLRAPPSTQT